MVELYPSYQDQAYRIEFWGDEIDAIYTIDPLLGEIPLRSLSPEVREQLREAVRRKAFAAAASAAWMPTRTGARTISATPGWTAAGRRGT